MRADHALPCLLRPHRRSRQRDGGLPAHPRGRRDNARADGAPRGLPAQGDDLAGERVRRAARAFVGEVLRAPEDRAHRRLLSAITCGSASPSYSHASLSQGVRAMATAKKKTAKKKTAKKTSASKGKSKTKSAAPKKSAAPAKAPTRAAQKKAANSKPAATTKVPKKKAAKK